MASSPLPGHLFQWDLDVRSAHQSYPVETAPCQQCHDPHASARAGLFRETLHPPFIDGNCVDCHALPGSDEPFRTNRTDDKLCGDCHDVEVTAPAGGSIHAPAATGDCVSCHQPHASEIQPFLRAAARPLCTSCHQAVEDQLTSTAPHAPAEDDDGCLTCHGPHATGHPALLTESVADTCLMCHDGDSSDFAEHHLGMPASTMDCRGCHDPHASQLAGMLLPEQHAPFADGDCSICHEEASQ